MEALQREVETAAAEAPAPLVMERLVAMRRRTVADAVEPLRVEAERVAGEIDVLRDAARRKVWETIVQTREIHDRICDATARLEHLQLDIREQTGEVRLPSVPMPFVDFLMSEIRRFVVTAATPDGEKLQVFGR
jgi:hypothetical protein